MVVRHADGSVQAAEEWSEIGGAAFLDEDVELMRFCDDFLKETDYFRMIQFMKKRFILKLWNV